MSAQDLLPTPSFLHKGSFPITRSLIFPQKFLGVIHSVWFLYLPPPNHLDPIYKPQTAQEFMQDLFWERLEGKCKPDKTEARSRRPALIRKVDHNYQGERSPATRPCSVARESPRGGDAGMEGKKGPGMDRESGGGPHPTAPDGSGGEGACASSPIPRPPPAGRCDQSRRISCALPAPAPPPRFPSRCRQRGFYREK